MSEQKEQPFYLFLHPAQYDLLMDVIGRTNPFVRIQREFGKRPLTLEEYLDATDGD